MEEYPEEAKLFKGVSTIMLLTLLSECQEYPEEVKECPLGTPSTFRSWQWDMPRETYFTFTPRLINEQTVNMLVVT